VKFTRFKCGRDTLAKSCVHLSEFFHCWLRLKLINGDAKAPRPLIFNAVTEKSLHERLYICMQFPVEIHGLRLKILFDE
jgi:hypothetical protein